ncbi:MAG: Arm DNA-binding domain-containing protein, partial [Aliidongia sp.]
MQDKLTKRSVESVKPGAKDVLVWDTDMPGFGVKVTPKAGRIYVLQYRHLGRVKRFTIGRHGVDCTADEARREAVRLRGLVADGQDPAVDRAIRRKAITTMRELGERYMAEYAEQHKKPSGIAQDRRNLDNHVFPLLGTVPLAAVTKQDVARAMREIAMGATAKDEKTKKQGRRLVRGGEIVANRVHALLSKMFALAEDWKLRPDGSNPCRGTKRYAEHKVERFLSTDELARLGVALAAAERGELRLEAEPVAPEPAGPRKRGG